MSKSVVLSTNVTDCGQRAWLRIITWQPLHHPPLSTTWVCVALWIVPYVSLPVSGPFYFNNEYMICDTTVTKYVLLSLCKKHMHPSLSFHRPQTFS
jgi:hypothetical protein